MGAESISPSDLLELDPPIGIIGAEAFECVFHHGAGYLAGTREFAQADGPRGCEKEGFGQTAKV